VDEAQFLHDEQLLLAFEELEEAFKLVEKAATEQDIDISPYLPEPKGFREIQRLPQNIQKDWFKSIKKEIKFLIENLIFDKDETPKLGDEIIPAIIVFKAKVTSRGYLDKVKARCVARGDLQQKSDDLDSLWSSCVFARTFKLFVTRANRL